MTRANEYVRELMMVTGIIIIGIVLMSNFQDNSPTQGEILERPQRQKEAVLDQIAQGKILYLKSERYKKFDPSKISNRDAAWVGPEYTVGEAWMGADASGNTSFQIGVSRTLQGDLLAVSKWGDGRMISTWIPTGEEMEVETGSSSSLTAWVEGIWNMAARQLDRGWSYMGHGELNGEQSLIFETQYTNTKVLSNEEAEARGLPSSLEDLGLPSYEHLVMQQMVNRMEFVETIPLIWWSSQWELSEEGERTLVEEHRVLEYRLLPADTQIGPFQ